MTSGIADYCWELLQASRSRFVLLVFSNWPLAVLRRTRATAVDTWGLGRIETPPTQSQQGSRFQEPPRPCRPSLVSGETDSSPAQRHGSKETSPLHSLHIPELPSPSPPSRERRLHKNSIWPVWQRHRKEDGRASRQALRCCDMGTKLRTTRVKTKNL